LLTAIAYVLRKAGYAVATASSGPEAVAVFQNTQPDTAAEPALKRSLNGPTLAQRPRPYRAPRPPGQ
jgi:CheY-like chemotaxis protein